MAPLAVCSGLPLVRDGSLGAPAFDDYVLLSGWWILHTEVNE